MWMSIYSRLNNDKVWLLNNWKDEHSMFWYGFFHFVQLEFRFHVESQSQKVKIISLCSFTHRPVYISTKLGTEQLTSQTENALLVYLHNNIDWPKCLWKRVWFSAHHQSGFASHFVQTWYFFSNLTHGNMQQ